MTAKVKFIANQIGHHLMVYRLVLKDHDAPKQAKILLGFAVAYIPFPLSMVISTLLIVIALKMIPKDVIESCKVRVSS